ncbi:MULTISPECIES: glycoside hydrolase family 15 protein [unclassified Marinimicrobium]|jgi:phosphorylase kinase alpha/beta subunit|uniref:glycoside hydrolase family 15 protein n=1 Tax=unclassified Marinimicrobium TaxID=2632100 RepID=UPI00257AC23D|nr:MULTISPECIES: glycoside hydrolase family 15 protein [unclassified Marinimicrobium]
MKNKSVLNQLFQDIDTVILSRQHPVTGLLPASTSVNHHGDYTDAWVRDNVYSVVCVWALGMALRHAGDRDRSDQLEQATIKLMRGLLQSMMRQSDKVETFKSSLDPLDALHAKYDTASGLTVVADDAWGHLQIDATSLYLLMLAQMTASGLRIVTTFSEVDFVQNLVYYISSAYRTPDYGIWERGNKINNGKTEINASSVGMAKAALQALDGFNLFGPTGPKRATIHVVADAISLARTTLASLLPRESVSKEVDSALLSIIGFPAFAVSREKLVTRTRDEILGKLGGHYGCKRFIWDGHQTVLEETSRLYYEHSELANFEHVESEWPLFFTYLYIQALFDGNESTAQHYRDRLESLMVNVDGIGLLPELYYLPDDRVAAEKKQPGSQERVANDNVPLVWAQSLYWTGLIMHEGLLEPDHLDPLSLRRRATKFIKSNIALVVLTDNEVTKGILSEHGVIAETLQEIQPLIALPAPELVKAYGQVGANPALKLTGRPARRLQSLASSQTYQINGKVYLTLSWLQSEEEDYRLYDAQWFSESLAQEIEHIRKHWINQEVAVFTLLMTHELCQMPQIESLFEAIRSLQLRTEHDHVGYASANLAYRASRVNALSIRDVELEPLAPRDCSRCLDQWDDLAPEAQTIWDSLTQLPEIELQKQLAGFLHKRDLDALVGQHDGEPVTLQQWLEMLYRRTRELNQWLMARYCFAALNRFHSDLAGSLSVLAMRHLLVVLGDKKHEFIVSAQLSNDELMAGVLRTYNDPVERTLAQEMLAQIGTLVRTRPELFDGLRSIHLHNFMQLCLRQGRISDDYCSLDELGVLPPSTVTQRLIDILTYQRRIFTEEVQLSKPEPGALPRSAAEQFHALDADWFEWRLARGLVTRLDNDFLKAIWQSLAHAVTLEFGDRDSEESTLECELVRSSMTSGEESFAQLIDRLTQQLHPAYYKTAVVEALSAFTHYCEANPEAYFEQPVVFSQVLEAAARQYVAEKDHAKPGTRDIDNLLEQSPEVLQSYVNQVLAELDSATQPA